MTASLPRNRKGEAGLRKRLEARAFPCPASGCHFYDGYLTEKGYGRMRLGRRLLKAHRVAWEMEHGPIPSGQVVCHRCDIPSCVNPTHLFLGTQGDNVADMVTKGRNRSVRGSDHPCARLSEEDVVAIRASSETTAALSRKYGLTKAAVRSARNGKTWSHIQSHLEKKRGERP